MPKPMWKLIGSPVSEASAQRGSHAGSAVALEAGGCDRVVRRHQGGPRGANHRAAPGPPPAGLALIDDARATLAQIRGEPRLPQIARQRPEVDVIVTRVESFGRLHG